MYFFKEIINFMLNNSISSLWVVFSEIEILIL